MKTQELRELLEKLVKLPKETEWVEFKLNYHSMNEIGERISALSNGACLFNQQNAYLTFGIADENQNIIGTSFKPFQLKKGNEELEHWLIQRLSPKIDFRIYEFLYNDLPIVIFEIPATTYQPVKFINHSYIRIGSYTRKLQEFPEKEAKIWNKQSVKAFELEIAKRNLSQDNIVELLNIQAYFDLVGLPYPTNRSAVIDKFISEKFITKNNSKFSITNLGAILFAKNLAQFDSLSRKAVRVIVYKGKNRIFTEREQPEVKGYAVGFEGLVNWINSQLPANEEIGKVYRREVKMYPEIAIRELVANALIHQDFSITGLEPIVEIFSDRIEISNSGIPLIKTNRFIDEFQTRNEILASFMRRIKICEEKGSGIDKVIFNAELFQLPAPEFIAKERQTISIMYGYKALNDMDKKDKIRAVYQHACLCYVSNEKMTNQSLRERFKIEEKNAATVSRIIRDSLQSKSIKEDDPNSKSRKYAKYIPFWA
ncbi:MAG: transcriptional regulator [Bacteroidetes bacterium]|jgi:ATP-dependent DNA helicase RecG|nr:transcriptional regulator [Bacteroidota bacterium]MBT6687169.1 transcriptional regulator [Bacteroidota bacterium]MBT7144929.1 transcriptional regulator [Bacteroidota bacterium]MBT7492980.1 transcriptional regulator [Bacteroidota bacterium]